MTKEKKSTLVIKKSRKVFKERSSTNFYKRKEKYGLYTLHGIVRKEKEIPPVYM